MFQKMNKKEKLNALNHTVIFLNGKCQASQCGKEIQAYIECFTSCSFDAGLEFSFL